MPLVAFVDSPIGRLAVAATDAGLLAIERVTDGADRADGAEVADVADALAGALAGVDPERLDSRRAVAAARALRGWFDGTTTELEMNLDLRDHGPWDHAVFAAARRIPYGSTASYGEIAIMAGHPGAARAVGSALARCRVAPVVPCHRIIAADGGIGGWGSDLWTKRWLLEHERRHARAG